MDASLQEIRVGVFGLGDYVLPISDPPYASQSAGTGIRGGP